MSEIIIKKQFFSDQSSDFIAILCLNRPQYANALNLKMMTSITKELQELNDDSSCRVLLIKGEGKHFCAGADLKWMKDSSTLNYEENFLEAQTLTKMFEALYNFSKPTIAYAQGAIFGGAVGILACCDIVIGDETSNFCLSELKLGLIPAVIMPYLTKKIKSGQLRRLSLTAQSFHSDTAYHIGLIELNINSDDFNSVLKNEIQHILRVAPKACQAFKDLYKNIEDNSRRQTTQTAERIAQIRVSAEAQSGLKAFFNKKTPSWNMELAKEWKLNV